jgi:hypothetical protein
VDTEQCVSAQHFDVPVLEVERAMWCYDRGVGGGFVIRYVCNGEVGESGDAYGRRLGDGGCRNRVCLWGGNRIDWRGLTLRDPRFGIPTREPQGCDDRSCSGVFLTHRFRLPDREHRWRRETVPATLP